MDNREVPGYLPAELGGVCAWPSPPALYTCPSDMRPECPRESVTLVPMRNLPALLLRGGSVCRGTVSMLTGWLLVDECREQRGKGRGHGVAVRKG